MDLLVFGIDLLMQLPNHRQLVQVLLFKHLKLLVSLPNLLVCHSFLVWSLRLLLQVDYIRHISHDSLLSGGKG